MCINIKSHLVASIILKKNGYTLLSEHKRKIAQAFFDLLAQYQLTYDLVADENSVSVYKIQHSKM